MSLREVAERAEQYIVELLNGRRKTRGDLAALAVLFLLSRLYRSIVQLRLRLFNQRLFRQRMLGCLVVSIGNLTVGGTGKTPVVERFARALQAGGRKVAILSRGYKSKKPPLLRRIALKFNPPKEYKPRVVSDGNGE